MTEIVTTSCAEIFRCSGEYNRIAPTSTHADKLPQVMPRWLDKSNKSASEVSPLYVTIVNSAEKLGIYKAIVDRVQQQDKPVQLPVLILYSTIIAQVAAHMENSSVAYSFLYLMLLFA